jgi:dienelactone hydrolase
VETVWKRSAETITIPTLILWSKNDMRVTVEVGEALEKALKDAGRPVQMKVYPSFDTDGHALRQCEGVPDLRARRCELPGRATQPLILPRAPAP